MRSHIHSDMATSWKSFYGYEIGEICADLTLIPGFGTAKPHKISLPWSSFGDQGNRPLSPAQGS